MEGVINLGTGDLIRAGFSNFTAKDNEAVRTDVPYPPFVKGVTSRYHRWTGSEWEVKSIPAIGNVVNQLIVGTFDCRDPMSWPGDDHLIRLAPDAYEDGESVPPETGRPNPRAISNAVCDQLDSITVNDLGCTDMFWIWGQFVDHDISLTDGNVYDPMFISVPSGDPHFDPLSTGTVEIPLNRSLFIEGTGENGNARTQVNHISSFIDATNIYGTEGTRHTWLREHVGGRLRVGQGNIPPHNDKTMTNAGPNGDTAFVVGDIRGNENVALLSMHTLLVREHNYWANKLYKKSPNLSDDELFHRARVIVESEVQGITWNEYLPLLLGENALPAYTGYDSEADPRVANEFSAAAYRLGHTLVSNTLWRLDSNNQPIGLGHLSLADAFFNPSKFTDEGGIDPVLQGACRHHCQKLDVLIVGNLRNFLFGPPGAGGHDLVALNIQRGRDHGLADLNTVRTALSLTPHATFADLTSDSDLATALSTLYGGDINKVDLFVGGLVESKVAGSQLGETFQAIVSDQFIRLRDSDPMWYENRLTQPLIDFVNNNKLSDILKRNTTVQAIQDHVMVYP